MLLVYLSPSLQLIASTIAIGMGTFVRARWFHCPVLFPTTQCSDIIIITIIFTIIFVFISIITIIFIFTIHTFHVTFPFFALVLFISRSTFTISFTLTAKHQKAG
jgi:hypothetical protein